MYEMLVQLWRLSLWRNFADASRREELQQLIFEYFLITTWWQEFALCRRALR